VKSITVLQRSKIGLKSSVYPAYITMEPVGLATQNFSM